MAAVNIWTSPSTQYPGVAPADVMRRVAAVCSLGAAAIHFGVAGEHFGEWSVYGVFFVLLGGFQVVWSLAAWTHEDRRLLVAGLAASALTVLLWLVTRTTGLPFGPDAHVAEDVGAADAICTALEVVQAALLGLLVVRRRPARRLSPLSAVAITSVAGVLVLGGANVALSAPMGHGDASTHAQVAAGNGNRMDMSDLPDVGNATAAQTAAAHEFLDQTKATIATYVDPDAARADGYDIQAALQKWRSKHPGKPGDAVIPALHVRNAALRDDTAVADPTKPETVIYLRTPSGRLLLEGVMYTAGAPGQEGSATEHPPDIGGPYTRWHYHEPCATLGHDQAAKQRSKVKPGPDGSCPDGTKLRRTGYMMHVWNVSDDDLVEAYAMSPPALALLRNAEATHQLSAAAIGELRTLVSRIGRGKHAHDDLEQGDGMT